MAKPRFPEVVKDEFARIMECSTSDNTKKIIKFIYFTHGMLLHYLGNKTHGAGNSLERFPSVFGPTKYIIALSLQFCCNKYTWLV